MLDGLRAAALACLPVERSWANGRWRPAQAAPGAARLHVYAEARPSAGRRQALAMSAQTTGVRRNARRAQLREELGARAMAGREPPPRRALAGVNRRPDLVERRRRDLEQWLWRLVADPELARARPLNAFLELSDAARLVQRCGPRGSCRGGARRRSATQRTRVPADHLGSVLRSVRDGPRRPGLCTRQECRRRSLPCWLK